MARTLFLLALWAGAVFAYEGLPGLSAPLTVVLDTEQPLPAQTMAAMRHEMDRLVGGSRVRIEWKMRGDVKTGESHSDLVLVKFHGDCRMESGPVLFDERGPMAFTYSSDGDILPFSEVSCERVRGAARSAMTAGDAMRGDLLMGRALARVVAHEMYHMVSRDEKHSAQGVLRKGLSGAQLIAEQFRFTEEDLRRLDSKAR